MVPKEWNIDASKTYMDQYLKDLDDIDVQMDWEFFREEDKVENSGKE